MSVTLLSARRVSPRGTVLLLDSIHINGSAIRYVHLSNVNVQTQVEGYLMTLDRIVRSVKPKQFKETETKRRRIEAETCQVMDDPPDEVMYDMG